MELAEWKGRGLSKLCGAEVYTWNESGMKCKGSKWGTNVVLGMEWAWMECRYLKHMDKSTRNVFVFCNNYRAVGEMRKCTKCHTTCKLLKGAWHLSPYLENLLWFSLLPKNGLSMKIIIGFRGYIVGLAVRLNNAPVRCDYFLLYL